MNHRFVQRPRPPGPAAAVVLAVAWLAGGCGASAGDGGAPASAVRDSAGVRIVDNVRPAWGEAEAWRVGDPLLTVGGDDDDDLFDVSGAALLPGGAVAVAAGGTAQVRFHGADGALLAAWGGAGDGPREFRLMGAMGRAGGDTVWVQDYGAGRLALLTPGEGFVGVLTFAPPLPAGAVVGRRSDGSVVVGQMWGSPAPGERPAAGLSRPPAAYVAYGADGRLADTLGFFPGRELLQREEDGRMVMGTAPFARLGSHTLLGDDLVVGDQVVRSLSLRSPSGGVTLVRWPGPDLALTHEDVRAWEDALVEGAAAAERPSLRAWLADAPAPPTRPAYGRFLADPAGHLWVAEYAGAVREPGRWNVFDGAGRWLGPVVVPEGFLLLAVGEDRVVGVTHDDLDVERVEVRPLVRP